MEYLVKDEKIELIHEHGKGAWTYHIKIPNSKHIVGKWGSLKVSGFIDDYKIEAKNLFTINGQDKKLSVSQTIRTAINKTGGDFVTVTLYLLPSKIQVTESEILDTFKESEVLGAFKNLSEGEQKAMIQHIIAQKKEEKQIQAIVKAIDHLSRNSTH